jgi:hypothetical protein
MTSYPNTYLSVLPQDLIKLLKFYICHVKICAKIIALDSYATSRIASCIGFIKPFVDVIVVGALWCDDNSLQNLSQKYSDLHIVYRKQLTMENSVKLIYTTINRVIDTNDPKELYSWYLFHVNTYDHLPLYNIHFPDELRQKLSERYYKEKRRKITSMAEMQFDLIKDFKHT